MTEPRHRVRCTLALICAALLALSCATTTPPRSPHPPPDVPLIVLGEEHLPYLLGTETVVAELEILGMRAGSMKLAITPRCNDAGEIDVSAVMRTVGMIRFFVRRDGEAKTLLDPKSGLPKQNEVSVNDGEMTRSYETRFSQGNFEFVFSRNRVVARRGGGRIPDRAHAHDLQSAPILLRSWRPEPGAKGYFYVLLGERLWRAELVYRGPETIETGGRARRAVKIEGTTYKLAKDSEDQEKPRRFTLWFSDDERRAPLKAVSEASFGTVHLSFTSHEVTSRNPCAAAAKDDTLD